MNSIVWCLFSLFFCSVFTLQLPPDFPKCKRSDPQINECLKPAIEGAKRIMRRGLPDFKIETIEPIKITSMTIAEGTGPVRVVQDYKNCEIFNIATAKVINVSSVITDNVFELNTTAFFEEVYMVCEYKLNGNILLFSIFGEGKCTIKLKNERTNFTLIGEFTERNGKKYVEIVGMKVNLHPEKVEIDFKNLFNGDLNLGSQMNKILSDNWEELYVDVGHAYETAFEATFKNIANRIFKKIPYDELFLP